MPIYRVEILNRQNKVSDVHRVDCDSDVEAIAEARSFAGPDHSVLLLQNTRPITAFKPSRTLPN